MTIGWTIKAFLWKEGGLLTEGGAGITLIASAFYHIINKTADLAVLLSVTITLQNNLHLLVHR